MEKRTAVVFGATGLIGGYLVDFILKEEDFDRLIMVSRRPVDKQHHKLTVKIIDLFDSKAVEEAIPEEAVVFSAIGTTMRNVKGDKAFYRSIDYGINMSIGDACVTKNAAMLLLVSSIGANSKSKNFYTALKGEIEDALRQKPINRLLIFQPSLLMGQRQTFRFGERMAQIIMPLFSFLMPQKYRPIHASVVARQMLEAANDLEKINGRPK